MDHRHNNSRAVALIRVSSLGQKDNTSRTTQEKTIRDYCVTRELELVRVFPLVESARVSELRRGYKEALKWIERNNVLHLVYYKQDREARNLTDNENSEKLTRSGKVVIHYVQEGKILDSRSPDSDFLMKDYLAVQNKHYSRDLSTKVRTATKAKAETGWFPGRWTVLGYKHEKQKDDAGRDLRRGSTIVKDSNQRTLQQVIREFELRGNENLSLRMIRERIIEEGFIPAEMVSRYHISTIEDRLKCRFYIGYFTWQGIEYRGKHELFVPPGLFWRVQDTFGIKSPHIRRSEGIFGGGWLRCADPNCGCHIVYDPKKKTIKKTGEVRVFPYYHCTNGKRAHASQKGMNVSEKNIWGQFQEAVKLITISQEYAQQIVDAVNQDIGKQRREATQKLGSYKLVLKEIEHREDRIYDDYLRGILDEAGYRRQLSKVRDEKTSLAALLRQAQFAETAEDLHSVNFILELATDAESLWKKRSAEERKTFLNDLLSNPLLDGVTVRYEIVKPLRLLSEMKTNKEWRRGRDSNPRNHFWFTRFRGELIQPLSHLSVSEI